MRRIAKVLTVMVLCATGFAAQAQTLPSPLVIAHRGASGTLPEHTLEAYGLAIGQGAHFIEPDLVSTSDGVLVVRHENELSDTTDVAAKFPGRRTTKTIDGREVTGWFVEDFNMSEVKQLKAIERLPFRDQANNGRFSIPTFDEVLALIQRESSRRGRSIGVYPETKHPTYFRSIGLGLEVPLLTSLDAADLKRPDDWVFIQSFEVTNLKDLNGMTSLRLVQLLGSREAKPYDQTAAGKSLTYGTMMTEDGLAEIATYAEGIGPWKVLIVPNDGAGNALPVTGLVERAHAAGLLVHPYTFRDEEQYLIQSYAGDPLAEYRRFYSLGVDGVFTDFPDTAIQALP